MTLTSLVSGQVHVDFNTRELKEGQRIEDLPAMEQLVRSFDDMEAYQTWKQNINGAQQHSLSANVAGPDKVKPNGNGVPKGGGVGVCDCWREPDDQYITIDNDSEWNASGFNNADDGSYGPIDLPFQFYLYGQFWTTAYININGNVSFGNYYGTFSPSGFPVTGFTMVAPFWGDVDLRGTACTDCNTIKYKVTPTALYVNWPNVGYYNSETDKLNTFQLIITDGTDPVIPTLGSNVSFCYQDMQWTTGAASGGINGFGGTPASVGANHGNGFDYLLFGRFDHEGTDYDGPDGAVDGVSWLDDKSFGFATDSTTGNISPAISGQSVCSELTLCSGQTVELQVLFYAPEPEQTTTANSTSDLSNYTIIDNTPGNTASITTSFTTTDLDIGVHLIQFTGTDDGTPPLTSILQIIVTVLPGPTGPPVITGDATACAGMGTVLVANGNGLANYQWSNGFNGQTVLVGAGTYTVTVGAGDCLFTSEPFTVTDVPLPQPDITGTLYSCGGIPATLGTALSYDQYLWSNGSTDPTITVGTGSYSVTVTDAEGCVGTAAVVNVVSANDPQASMESDSPLTVFPGTTITYTNTSTIDGSTITGITWFVDSVFAGSGGTLEYLFDVPGYYAVTLTVTTADGCTNSFVYFQTVIPTEILVPNVFSPNGDGRNDVLEFSGVEYYPNSKLTVYNRWGQAIFESGNYKNTWRAPDVAEGTYYFVLKMQNGKEYTGHVTLLR